MSLFFYMCFYLKNHQLINILYFLNHLKIYYKDNYLQQMGQYNNYH